MGAYSLKNLSLYCSSRDTKAPIVTPERNVRDMENIPAARKFKAERVVVSTRNVREMVSKRRSPTKIRKGRERKRKKKREERERERTIEGKEYPGKFFSRSTRRKPASPWTGNEYRDRDETFSRRPDDARSTFIGIFMAVGCTRRIFIDPFCWRRARFGSRSLSLSLSFFADGNRDIYS